MTYPPLSQKTYFILVYKTISRKGGKVEVVNIYFKSNVDSEYVSSLHNVP
jgi:hypothetical protein